MSQKLVFVFPGQGSQFQGMGKDLFENFPSAKRIFEVADQISEIEISKICFEGPEELLRKTSITQPAIFTTSVSCFEILKEKGILPEIVAGHSLGEYSALYAGGVASFEELLRLVILRGKLMEDAGDGKGAMAAIIGLDKEKVAQICQDLGEGVVLANINSQTQQVISGLKEKVAEAGEKAKTAGAKKVVFLEVSGAFHSPFMKKICPEFKNALDNCKFQDSKFPIISNVTAQPVTQKEEIKRLLLEQIYSPVLWLQSVEYLINQGFKNFIEVGPGKVLQGLLRRINPDVKLFGVSDKISFEETIKELESCLS